MNNNLKKFIDFLSSTKKEPADIYVIKSPDTLLKNLLGDKSKKYFRIYFRTKAGDLVGEWDKTGEFTDESLPIVWLSSEGVPNTVIAKDNDEFLSLIPYGGSFVSDIPTLFEKYMKAPDVFMSPEEEYTKEDIQKEYDYQAKQFKGHAEMVDFITKKLKINLNQNPFETIGKTIQALGNLDVWIDKKLKE